MSGYPSDWAEFVIGKKGRLVKEGVLPANDPERMFAEYSMPAFDGGGKPDHVRGKTMLSGRNRISGEVLLFNKLNVRKRRVWHVKSCEPNAVASGEFLAYQSDEIDLGLLQQIMVTDDVTAEFEGKSTGTSNSQKRIRPSAFLEFKVMLPGSVEEQKRIAKALGDMDGLIENIGQRIAKKQLVKKGAMQELLSGKKRLPGFKEAWTRCQLGDIAKYATASIPIAMIDKYWYVGTENMEQECKGIVPNTADVPYASVRAYAKGDVLISNIRPYLKKCWLADRSGGCSTDVLVLRGVDDKVISSYLYMIVSDDAFFKYSMENVVGTKMPRGDKKAILRYAVNIPPKDEQGAIAEVLLNMDAEIDNLEKQQAKLKLVKKGMMQDLLTGKVRI